MSYLRALLTPLLLISLALARDNDEHRSHAARDAFMRSHPCPASGATRGPCPGYVVDHVVALRCGGADAPRNMQWQTVAAAKRKDRIERRCLPPR